MGTYRERAVVLRTWKLGETDRILSLLTAGRGKVRAVAKGVRRPGSRFGARLEPYSTVDLQLYEGRSLDGVSQAELVEPHDAVRNDFARATCAATMVELVDGIAQEEQRDARLFLLLTSALDALEADPADPALFLDAFLLRAAAGEGVAVRIETCVACGSAGPHPYLSVVRGGTLCADDAPAGTRAVPADVVELLRLLASDRWTDLAAVAADAATRDLAGRYVRAFVEHHLDRRLRSWDMVERA